jgi:hypothetical protein
MAACNFGISKTALSRHLLKFQEQATPTDFEYTARNDVKEILSATQELELVEYFKQAAKLPYGLTKKETLKHTFQYDKENGVVIPQSWIKNETAGNVWLRGLRKHHESLCLRKLEATSLTRSTNFNHENAKAFFENFREFMSRHSFTADKIYNLDETDNSTVIFLPDLSLLRE